MYVPAHFAEERPEAVAALVREASFGHLVVAAPDGLASTPVPFVVDDGLTTVRAHLARANPFHRLAPCDALLIVPAGDAYVSPRWYPSKAEHGKVVPTWNYEVVHLHGRLLAHDDDTWIAEQMRAVTDEREARLAGEAWSVDDPPDGFVAAQRRATVGVSLAVGRVEAKRKLSQNRSDADRAAVTRALRAGHEASRPPGTPP